jgi:Zn-dependent oligopeptidase
LKSSIFYTNTALTLNFTSNFNFPLPTAAGYRYLWREVLDADAFATVEEVVILDG